MRIGNKVGGKEGRVDEGQTACMCELCLNSVKGHVFSMKKDAGDKDSSKHGVVLEITLWKMMLHLPGMQHSSDVQGWQHPSSIHDILLAGSMKSLQDLCQHSTNMHHATFSE